VAQKPNPNPSSSNYPILSLTKPPPKVQETQRKKPIKNNEIAQKDILAKKPEVKKYVAAGVRQPVRLVKEDIDKARKDRLTSLQHNYDTFNVPYDKLEMNSPE
jgi:hypothetical protein